MSYIDRNPAAAANNPTVYVLLQSFCAVVTTINRLRFDCCLTVMGSKQLTTLYLTT